MSKGARVVRGPDWAGKNQDGGEGSLGTVISETVANGKVKVAWDTGQEGHYRAGQDGKFELRVYDNAPLGAIHETVTCDVCRMQPLEGIRWKCATCDDFDLCLLCYMSGKHDLSHPFLRHDTETSTLVPVDSRKKVKVGYLHGILPGANVSRGLHWKWRDQDGGNTGVGDVTGFETWGKIYYRGGVKVKWENGVRNTYRCGGEGCVDLLLIGETKKTCYYPQHLPVLDVKNQLTCQLKPGDKVRVDVDPATVKKVLCEAKGLWNEKMAEYLPQLGTVIELKHSKIARLQYEDAQFWYIYTSMLTKVHSFVPGNAVQILSNLNAVQELQRGHGGWNDQMEYIIGGLAIVEKVEDDGDVKVKARDMSWLLSPVCCQYVEPERLTNSQQAMVDQSTPKPKPKSPESSIETPSRDIGDGLAEMLLKLLQNTGDKPQTLIEAAAQANLQGVKEMVKANPKLVNEAVDGTTPLQMACYKGNCEVVVFLLDSKANIDFPDKDGDTPLHFAVAEQKVEVVKILVGKKANLDKKNNTGQTPCHLAVYTEQIGIVKILVDNKCDVNTQDKEGDTPFHDALSKENETIAELLLNVKTIKFDIFNKDGFCVFHQALMANKETLCKQMLEKQPSLIRLRTKTGDFTPLHIAVANGFISLTNVLIKPGNADVNACDGTNQSPLHLAVMKRSQPIVDILLVGGSDVNAQDNEGNTPSHLAHLQSSLKRTTTMSATQSQMTIDDTAQIDIPYVLANSGADLLIKNKQGKTPMDLIPKEYGKLLSKIAKKPNAPTAGGDLDPPRYWESMRNSKLKLVEMNTTEPLTGEEHNKVTRMFKKTLSNQSSIIRIQRIQNLDTWEHFAVKKRTMERAYGRGCANELQLFHGTKPDLVEPIVNIGIDFRMVERALYGDGSYFATDSKISDYYTKEDGKGHRFMFMVRVLTGKFAQGEQGLKKPPSIEGDKNAFYDSVVDKESDPKVYVIFDNTQCYPEYIIEYKQ